MASTTRKFKLKKDNKGLKSTKRAIACIGQDEEGDFIFMNIKSRSFLDRTYNDLSAKILSEFNLPIKEKRLVEMTELEKEVYNIRKEEDKQSKMVICYDETNPKYKKVKNQIDKFDVIAQLVTYFDMEALVDDEEGNEVSHWERFGVPKNNWLALCRFLIDEDGLGLSEGEVNLISSEIMRMKSGEKTKGEKFLDVLEMEETVRKNIEETKKKIEEEKLKEKELEEASIKEGEDTLEVEDVIDIKSEKEVIEDGEEVISV